MNRESHIIAAALAQARRLREVHGSPQLIKLSVYATNADLRQLRPEDGPTATAAQQRRIVDAVAAALRADGHLVQIQTLQAVDYLRWLTATGKTNTAATRAEYLTHPTP